MKGIYKNLAAECVVLITGQSGAGKGTLVEGLQRLLPPGIFIRSLVSTGDQFRSKLKTVSPDVHAVLQRINDLGERQDGFVAAMLVAMRVMDSWHKNGLTIIEGSPRSPKEAEYLHTFFWGIFAAPTRCDRSLRIG